MKIKKKIEIKIRVPVAPPSIVMKDKTRLSRQKKKLSLKQQLQAGAE